MEFLQLLVQLRPRFLAVALALAAAATSLVGVLNGGLSPLRSPAAAAVAALLFALFGATMFAARSPGRVRDFVLRPEAKPSHVRLALDFLAAAGAVGALALGATAISLP